jgi:hypothetical protein
LRISASWFASPLSGTARLGRAVEEEVVEVVLSELTLDQRWNVHNT